MSSKSETKKSKKSEKVETEEEPYVLYEKSVNKDQEFLGYGFMDVVFHNFLNKVLYQGLREPFNFNHMYKLPNYLEFNEIIKQMDTLMTPEFKNEVLNNKKSMFDFYQKLIGFRLKLGVFLTFVSEVIIVFLPLLLKRLISWVEEDLEGADSSKRYEGVITTGLISLVIIISKLTLFSSRYFLMQAQIHAQAFAYVSDKVSILELRFVVFLS